MYVPRTTWGVSNQTGLHCLAKWDYNSRSSATSPNWDVRVSFCSSDTHRFGPLVHFFQAAFVNENRPHLSGLSSTQCTQCAHTQLRQLDPGLDPKDENDIYDTIFDSEKNGGGPRVSHGLVNE